MWGHFSWGGHTYFASRARAMMPATMGADTEVPVWPSVQRCLRSVVTCGERSCSPQNAPSMGTTPSSTPDLLPERRWTCGSQPLPWLQCHQGAQSPKNASKIHLVHEKTPLYLHFPLLKGAKTIWKGEKIHWDVDELEEKVDEGEWADVGASPGVHVELGQIKHFP